MKRFALLLLTVFFVLGTSVMAADTDGVNEQTEEQEQLEETTGDDVQSEDETEDVDEEDEDLDEDEDLEVEDEDEDEDSEDSDDSGKGKGKGKGNKQTPPGLENALENVKEGSQAEAVLTEILERYETPEDAIEELEELLDELEDLEDETTDEEEATDEEIDAEEELEDDAEVEAAEEETDEEAADEEELDEEEGNQEKERNKNKEALQLAKALLKQVDASDSPQTKKGQAYKKLAQFFAENEEWAEALESQEKLLEIENDLLENYELLGQLYEQAGINEVTAFVNGKKPEFDVPPVIMDGRTLVPFRAIAESLDAKVDWDQETRTVIIERDGTVVTLTIGSNVATINGEEVELDVPASITNGRTFVPARFIAEALNAEVDWVPEGQIVVITDSEDTDEEEVENTDDQQLEEQTDETEGTGTTETTDTTDTTDTTTDTP